MKEQDNRPVLTMNVGDWVCFYKAGVLVYSPIEYIDVLRDEKNVYTAHGALKDFEVLEVRHPSGDIR